MAEEQWFTFNPTKLDSPNAIVPRPTDIELQIQRDNDPLGKRNDEQEQAITRFKDANKGYTVESFYEDDLTHKSLNKMFGTVDDKGHPGQDLQWAYRCYKIKEPKVTLKNGGSHRILQYHIYLFNVIVAFEWEPGPTNLAVIEAAAHRASDFLFDVTDGWMAFGQVVIGGPALMDCADVQILASNRLNPRSWVGALHLAPKYMPIRLGRGVWQKNNRISIPWDEPEGYRILIHEWAHYALELRDAYTENHGVYLPGDTTTVLSRNEARRSNRELVVPSISQPVESIMSRLEGTSELVAHENIAPAFRKQKEWDIIVNGDPNYSKRFPQIPHSFEQLEGPLPLRELPHVVRLRTNGAPEPELLLPDVAIDDDIEREHCWVYLLKSNKDDIPKRIIAQGTIEAYQQGGFRIFGANVNDEIMLIGNGIDRRERVRSFKITAEAYRDYAPPQGQRAQHRRKTLEVSKSNWFDKTPAPFPVVDVVPEKPEEIEGIDRTMKVRVYVYTPTANQNGKLKLEPDKEARISIFPLDQVNYPGPSPDSLRDMISGTPTEKPISLDGHILIRWPNKKEQVIATFSQGGGPHTGSPTGPPPLTAGSSEGNLMIFFGDRPEDLLDDARSRKYAGLRIVTTRLIGTPTQAENNAEPRSYAFSLGSNGPLPSLYNPTLALAYDKNTELKDGTAEIYRFDESNGLWRSIPSYRPLGAWYVAAPLDSITAPRLFEPNLPQEQPRVERYRLFWVPRDARDKTTTTE